MKKNAVLHIYITGFLNIIVLVFSHDKFLLSDHFESIIRFSSQKFTKIGVTDAGTALGKNAGGGVDKKVSTRNCSATSKCEVSK